MMGRLTRKTNCRSKGLRFWASPIYSEWRGRVTGFHYTASDLINHVDAVKPNQNSSPAGPVLYLNWWTRCCARRLTHPDATKRGHSSGLSPSPLQTWPHESQFLTCILCNKTVTLHTVVSLSSESFYKVSKLRACGDSKSVAGQTRVWVDRGMETCPAQ